jgi:hypothetical protein
MRQVYFNTQESRNLRITSLSQWQPGRKYLMVHGRLDNNYGFAPPFCEEVWATGKTFQSYAEVTGREFESEQLNTKNHLIWYVNPRFGQPQYGHASDNGLERRLINWILDLGDLYTRGIEVIQTVAPGTDMTRVQPPDLFSSYSLTYPRRSY